MLKRIKYVSRFAKPLGPHEVTRLAELSAANNQKLGITGVLMSSGGMFFQIIEGPPEHVDALYRNIGADERHTNVLLLGSEDNVERRLFPDWSMKKIDLDDRADARLDPLKTILETIIVQHQLMENLTQTLERATNRWQMRTPSIASVLHESPPQ